MPPNKGEGDTEGDTEGGTEGACPCPCPCPRMRCRANSDRTLLYIRYECMDVAVACRFSVVETYGRNSACQPDRVAVLAERRHASCRCGSVCATRLLRMRCHDGASRLRPPTYTPTHPHTRTRAHARAHTHAHSPTPPPRPRPVVSTTLLFAVGNRALCFGVTCACARPRRGGRVPTQMSAAAPRDPVLPLPQRKWPYYG